VLDLVAMSVVLEESPPSPEPQYSTELRGETKGAEDDLGKRYHLLQNIEEECTTIYVCIFFCCCRPARTHTHIFAQTRHTDAQTHTHTYTYTQTYAHAYTHTILSYTRTHDLDFEVQCKLCG